jgi:transcriptional regulator with XRE-family HTH domain
MIRILAQERKKQKLSQETVSERMGIHRSNLARFERGEQNPTLDFLIKYAVALGMEPDMVLKESRPIASDTFAERKERLGYMSYKALLEKADFFKDEINRKRPLTKAEIRELDNYFKVGTTYASNAIEGNTLTLSETKVIIEDGITVGGKPLKFCYEATGHAKAYDYMISIARGDDFRITEEVILKLHKLFYSGIDEEYAGRYRDYQVFITGTEYLPPSPEDVPDLMKDFVSELHQKESVMHPIDSSFCRRKRQNRKTFDESDPDQ